MPRIVIGLKLSPSRNQPKMAVMMGFAEKISSVRFAPRRWKAVNRKPSPRENPMTPDKRSSAHCRASAPGRMLPLSVKARRLTPSRPKDLPKKLIAQDEKPRPSFSMTRLLMVQVSAANMAASSPR